MTARTIQTAAELDALPFPSVVAFPGHGDWHKIRDGRWLGDDGEILTSGELALVANGELAMTGDPSAPVLVVSDAAVDALSEWGLDERDVEAIREAVVDGAAWALLDHTCDLADRAPSAEAVQAAREDARMVLPFLAAQPAPEAPREDVAAVIEREVPTDLAGWRIRYAERVADALLARFVITERGER